MNDLMSGGAHRLWKRFTLSLAALRPGARALDVAGGTGDLAVGLARQVGRSGLVVLTDINATMLEAGRDRLINEGLAGRGLGAEAGAGRLPFPDASFDCVPIGFGLRNLTDKPRALAAMRRVLKAGGQLLVLEFSRPSSAALAEVYDAYSFRLLPLLGRVVAGDAGSYPDLGGSIRPHSRHGNLLRPPREGR